LCGNLLLGKITHIIKDYKITPQHSQLIFYQIKASYGSAGQLVLSSVLKQDYSKLYGLIRSK
jgi:hypothetical protein